MRGERRPSRNSATLYKRSASVDEAVHLQARDYVLHQELAALQLHDLKIVDRRMRAGFGNFRFQRPVPSLKLRKVRLYGHVGGFSSVRLLPDPESVHRFDPFSKWVPLVQRSNTASPAGLNAERQKRILFSRFWGSALRGTDPGLALGQLVMIACRRWRGRDRPRPGP